MHAEVSAVIPLTKAQRGLWVVSKLHTDNTLMLSEALEMFGPLDPQLLLRASMQLTREFDTLRLCIVEHDGVPGQVIRPDYTAAIPYFNVSEDPFPRDAAEHWLDEKVRKPDNLQDGPLWHCAVFRLGEDHHMWVHCANHLVVDGYSGSIMMQRMAALYNAYAEGVEPEPAQFGSALSLMEWEQQYLDSDRLQRSRILDAAAGRSATADDFVAARQPSVYRSFAQHRVFFATASGASARAGQAIRCQLAADADFADRGLLLPLHRRRRSGVGNAGDRSHQRALP